jgi:PAS domain S-box-containing protein
MLLYNLLVLASALLALVLAIYALARDNRVSGRAFALLMLAIAEWSLAYVFANFAPDVITRALWIGAADIGIAFAGPFWLLFALANTGRLEVLPRRAPLAIGLMGALSLVALLANDALAIWRLGLDEAVRRNGTLHGPLFWVHTLIAYTAVFAGLAACVRTLISARGPYRHQAKLLLLGAVLPLLVNMAHLAGLTGLPPSLDITPIALGGTGLAFAYAVRRHQMLTISPIARQVVLDSMREGLIVVDRAGLIVEHNPAAAVIAGLPSDAAGQPLATAVGNRALAAVLEDMLRDQGGAERSVSCAGAAPRRIHATRSPLTDPSGGQLGALFLLRDVTERVRAAQELARKAADLTTLHRVASAVGATLDLRVLLQTVVTTARDALGMSHATVGLFDESRRELTITAESDDAHGASALGTTFSVARWLEGDWGNGAAIVIEDALAEPRLGELRALLERRQSRALLIIPLRANDQFVGTLNLASAAPRSFEPEELALAQMIAGYVAAALANARLFEASQQAVRAKSAILDTVSHEFRTPITAILGFTELYQESVLGPVTEEQQEALEAVSRNAQRLLKLVDDLLDLARFESGNLDITLYPIEVELCVRDAAAIVEAQLRQKQLALRLDLADNMPLAWGDAMWLRRVLVHLLTNAIRFTTSGEIRVRAYQQSAVGSPQSAIGGDLTANRQLPTADCVVIEVEDTGAGIPELEHDTIFEAFRRAEDPPGTVTAGARSGLGLAISKRAIDQMEGQLSVRSRPGEGSTFTILLRLAELAVEHAEQ